MSAYVPNFSSVCQCGQAKANGALFCDGCFFELPEPLQAEINVRTRDYKATAERAAVNLLSAALGGRPG